MIGQSSLTLLILSKRIEKLRTISIKYHCRLNILWHSILHFPFNGTLFSKFSPMSFVGPWAAKREVMVMTSRLFSAAAGEVTPSFSLSRRFTAPLFSSTLGWDRKKDAKGAKIFAHIGMSFDIILFLSQIIISSSYLLLKPPNQFGSFY